MKKLQYALLPALFAANLASAGVAHAGVMVNTVDPNPNINIAYLGSYSFTHDLTSSGFVVGVDRLESALLSVLLRDDAGTEQFSFLLGTAQTESFSNVNESATGQTYTVKLDPASLVDLASDGMLNVTIRSDASRNNRQFMTGFIFDSSQLTAQVTTGGLLSPNAVPEPASLALLGIGLVGLGVGRYRRIH